MIVEKKFEPTDEEFIDRILEAAQSQYPLVISESESDRLNDMMDEGKIHFKSVKKFKLLVRR